MAGAQILREMGGDWLECQDGQGIFYHNAVTKQSSDQLPPELMAGNAPSAAAASTILRQLPNNWLECQDAQGIFFHNAVTKESVDPAGPFPPDLAMALQPAMAPPPAMAPQLAANGGQPESTILRELPNNWLECQDAQGIFFFNQLTQQSSDTMPVELMAAAPTMPAPMAAPSSWQPVAAPPMMAPVAVTAAVPTNPGQSVILRELPNNWLMCKDEQGIYFFNQATQASSDTLPNELAMAGIQVPTTSPVAVAQPMGVPMNPYMNAPMKAQVIGGGIQQSYAQSYTPTAASYAPMQIPQQPASYTPMQIPQQAMKQQVTAAPGSYVPMQVPQQIMQQQVAQPQVMYQQVQQPQPQQQVVYQQAPAQYGVANSYAQAPPQAQVVQAAPAPAGARKKSAWGDWIAFEENGVEFFVQVSTGQQFATPPQAAVESYQAYKAAGLVVPC